MNTISSGKILCDNYFTINYISGFWLCQEYSEKYLSITYSQQKAIKTEEGVVDIPIPNRVEIFNSQGKLLNIEAEYEKFHVTGFIEGDKDHYIFSQGIGESHEIGIYDMEGNFIKSLNSGYYSYSSPQGKFYYNQGGEYPLSIYDENGDWQFTIPTGGHLSRANAVSDSTLLVFNRGTLALWNIKTQEKIWESDIPSGLKGYVDRSSHIQFSIPGNIIALHSLEGYYCFNIQGDFLWADDDYDFHEKILDYTGVSKSSGDVIIVYSKIGTSHSLFAKIFNHEGILLEEHEIKLGENVKYARNTDFTAMVYNDYAFIRIFTGTVDQGIGLATCILYKENQSWSSAVVSGFWFLLNEGSQIERLIGYDPISKQIKGYQIR